MTRVLFRADASARIGVGHVMRIHAIAEALLAKGCSVTFAGRCDHPGLQRKMAQSGIDFTPLEGVYPDPSDLEWLAQMAHHSDTPFEWCVVDGCHFADEYLRAIKRMGMQVLWIDDFGTEAETCADMVLNPNYGATRSWYPNLDAETPLLGGVDYVILRKEFRDRIVRSSCQTAAVGTRVLVTMGGADPFNGTAGVIHALQQAALSGLSLTVVLGHANRSMETLRNQLRRTSISYQIHHASDQMPELIENADLSVICAGGTLWEMLFMGCPVATFHSNPIQETIVGSLARQGIVADMGRIRAAASEDIGAMIRSLLMSDTQRARMSRKGRSLIDGKGADRIARALLSVAGKRPSGGALRS